MKFVLFNEETKRIWNGVSSKMETRVGILELEKELELYKKLLNFFQVGNYYYLVFNLSKMDFEFVSPQVTSLLGYHPDEFNLANFMEIVHPDDRPWLLSYENKASEFLMALPVEKLMKFKVRYDFRLKTKSGVYIRVLHQSAIVEHDNDGRIAKTLCIQTDITHLKNEGKPVLSFIGMDGEPSFFDIDIKNGFVASRDVLSRREKQVLALLIEGKLSKEIGAILKISKQTVDKHRQNMIYKNNLSNTSELVGYAIRNGWI